jgi:hypothetical protein
MLKIGLSASDEGLVKKHAVLIENKKIENGRLKIGYADMFPVRLHI